MRERWAEAIEQRARAYWTDERVAVLARGKRLLLPPHENAPLLRALGLIRPDGSMPPDRVRKYHQVNHMVAMLGPSLRELATAGAVHIVDVGCGRSYLTLAIATYLRDRARVTVLGVDRKQALVDESRRRAEIAGLDEVRFEVGTIESLDEGSPIDALVALHACDTATCDAIAFGIEAGATLIATAPCCQAELARSVRDPIGELARTPFAPLFASPHLRREAAATLTDALRTLLLRSRGYRTDALEFVPSEHTPKNTLLRAMRSAEVDRDAALAELEALERAIGAPPIQLARRLAARTR